MNEIPSLPPSSILTTISIIVLVITFLLGQYNSEERIGRERFKPVYRTYINRLEYSLGLAILSFIARLVSGIGLVEDAALIISTLSVVSAILILAISTFLTSRDILNSNYGVE